MWVPKNTVWAGILHSADRRKFRVGRRPICYTLKRQLTAFPAPKSTHVIPLFKSSTRKRLSSSPVVKVLHWLIPICFSSLMYHKLSIPPSWMFPEHPAFTTPAHLYLGCFYLDHVICTSTSFQIQLKCRFHFEDPRPHPSFIHPTFISLL